jgi:hypothetical protein
MEHSKPYISLFQSEVKFVATYSLDVDATLYHQLVGSLLYLTHTHLDISFVVGIVFGYMKTPHEIHWEATKRILRYVLGIVQFMIHYNSEGTPLLFGFIDSNWVDEPDDQNLLQIMFPALV